MLLQIDKIEFKQLAESAAIEKYLEKKSRDVSGQVASDRILAFREKHGLVANSVDEVLSK